MILDEKGIIQHGVPLRVEIVYRMNNVWKIENYSKDKTQI
jgi:hypothetical protein